MQAENNQPSRQVSRPSPPAGWRPGWTLLVVALFLCPAPSRGGPFIDAVVRFQPGRNAGFGQDRFPSVVYGPPQGGGALQGSLDVLSLGHGGEIVVRFDPPLICDGPGPDFIVFENPFHVGSVTGPIFAELAVVAVSQDGASFRTFPYDATTWQGLAGKTPVYATPQNGIDPADPTTAGGDAFDLADVGLPWVAFVRITDGGDAIADPGNRIPPGNSAGFDLDAIVAIHPCNPAAPPTATASASVPLTPTATPSPTLHPSATPSALPSPSPTATVTPTRTATHTATSTASPTPTETWPPCEPEAMLVRVLFEEEAGNPLDLNRDGRISAADLVSLAAGEMVRCPP